MEPDYLIVGAGLTGSVIARLLADSGKDVVIVERRPQLGGNVHDYGHPSGIRIHSYGPHYFRTGSRALWTFVHRFSDFYSYEASLRTYVNGAYEHWPILESYIERVSGKGWKPAFSGPARNFEQAVLAKMPRTVYEQFVKGYTEKQWGVPADALSADLARRFDVRKQDDFRLSKHKYQGLPVDGYARFMHNLVAGIPVVLNFDYLADRQAIHARRLLIFTGPIDEFFGFDLGRLKYRGQRRDHQYLPDVDSYQPAAQVNDPSSDQPHIRTLEWKQMMPSTYADRIRGTVITREVTETPADPDRYEYPFPDESNATLYRRYRERADSIPGLLVCGRLGEYKYMDMDQAIGRAMSLAGRILAG